MRLLCVLLFAGSCVIGSSQTLVSFESETDTKKPRLETTLATVALSSVGTTHGSTALMVSFASSSTGYPAFQYVFSSLQDFSNNGLAGLDITNTGVQLERAFIVLTDVNNVKLEQYFDVRSGETRPCAVMIKEDLASNYGLRGLPLFKDGFNLGKQTWPTNFNYSQVKKMGVYFKKPANSISMAFDNIRVTPSFLWRDVLTGTVDRFGQRTWGDVPGKVASEADIITRRISEEAALAVPNPYEDRTPSGAWLTGPKFNNSSGYFRTVKYNGKWYLLDPQGYLFFSTGLGGLNPADITTPTEGREYMFEWLPSLGDTQTEFQSTVKINGVDTDCYNFVLANNTTKYGGGFEPWAARQQERINHWGFNTVGCFVDIKMWQRPNLPYIAELTCEPSTVKFAVRNSKNLMPDPYDSTFPANIEPRIRNYVNWYRINTDSELIGYITDNELPFRTDKSEIDLPLSVLTFSSTALAAKKALVDRFRGTYGTIERLNTAWGTSYAGWETLEAPVTTAPTSSGFVADMKIYLRNFCAKYFSQWKAAIRKYDTNHMYLGSKVDYFSHEILDGMKSSCNVFTFNRYGSTLTADFELLNTFDVPCILSEYGASTARGNNFAIGLSTAMVDTEAQRAEMVESMLRSTLAHKNFVGAHFFKLYDDPVVGSTKGGANSQWGLCDVTDTPYTEMVEMFKRVNRDIYKR